MFLVLKHVVNTVQLSHKVTRARVLHMNHLQVDLELLASHS